MNLGREHALLETRRHFFGRAATGIGTAALASLLNPQLFGAERVEPVPGDQGVLGKPHFTPTAKRVIYLFMSGAPSQLDMYDYKPKMDDLFDTDLPESVRMGQRLTGMSGNQASLPLAGSRFAFAQHGGDQHGGVAKEKFDVVERGQAFCGDRAVG